MCEGGGGEGVEIGSAACVALAFTGAVADALAPSKERRRRQQPRRCRQWDEYPSVKRGTENVRKSAVVV